MKPMHRCLVLFAQALPLRASRWQPPRLPADLAHTLSLLCCLCTLIIRSFSFAGSDKRLRVCLMLVSCIEERKKLLCLDCCRVLYCRSESTRCTMATPSPSPHSLTDALKPNQQTHQDEGGSGRDVVSVCGHNPEDKPRQDKAGVKFPPKITIPTSSHR